jgi:hypothetical protein
LCSCSRTDVALSSCSSAASMTESFLLSFGNVETHRQHSIDVLFKSSIFMLVCLEAGAFVPSVSVYHFRFTSKVNGVPYTFSSK